LSWSIKEVISCVTVVFAKSASVLPLLDADNFFKVTEAAANNDDLVF
jgi:hypothetical protein